MVRTIEHALELLPHSLPADLFHQGLTYLQTTSKHKLLFDPPAIQHMMTTK